MSYLEIEPARAKRVSDKRLEEIWDAHDWIAEEWPTTKLLAVFVRIQERGRRQGLAWRAATAREREAFWQLLKAEIDLRIPRRARMDASDEPIPWKEPAAANDDSQDA